jgi:hypothetical protein
MKPGMARFLAVLLIVGGFVVFLQLYTRGVDGAFGGALGRFWPDGGSEPSWAAESRPRSRADLEERAPRRPITQDERERVTRSIEQGARRHSGGD